MTPVFKMQMLANAVSAMSSIEVFGDDEHFVCTFHNLVFPIPHENPSRKAIFGSKPSSFSMNYSYLRLIGLDDQR